MKKLACIAGLVVSIGAHAAGARYHAREIKPTTDYVVAAAPCASPSAAHVEGTVVVSDGVSTMEVDVARTAVVARQPFSCGVLHRLSGVLVGSCGGDIVAFDAGLRVAWRAHWPTASNVVAKDLFAGGAGRIVATFEIGGELVLRVATAAGVVSEVRTGAVLVDAKARANVDVHGTTIIAFVSHHASPDNTLVALSPDGQRVIARRIIASPSVVWDDGTHVHVSDVAHDTTFDDSLHPIRTGLLVARPNERTTSIDVSSVDGLGGTGVRDEFDIGASHFWSTFGCCGAHPGLYIAKVR
jgi:hypothetical protein